MVGCRSGVLGSCWTRLSANLLLGASEIDWCPELICYDATLICFYCGEPSSSVPLEAWLFIDWEMGKSFASERQTQMRE